MDQNTSYLNYKLQQPDQSQSIDNPSSTSRKFKVKQLLRRYRNQSSSQNSQQDVLKVKLLNTYQKLQLQLSQNQRLKDIITEHQQRNSQVESQNRELKKLLQKVIENRKHIDRQLQQSLRTNSNLKQELQQYKLKQDQLLTENQLLKQHQDSLKQIINNNSKQISSLEAIIKQRTQLKQSHIQKSNHEDLKRNTKTSNIQIDYKVGNQNIEPNEMKPRRERQFKVGKWKKNIPAVIQQQPEQQQTNKNIQTQQMAYIRPLTDDQLLTIQQNKKKSLDQQLSKLMKIKKPGPKQNQRIQEIENELYKVESDISKFKKKIRGRY